MNKTLCFHLAATNIKSNKKLYLPYILSAAITTSMLYIIAAFSFDPGINELRGRDYLPIVFHFAIAVISVFSCIFLLYTNSVLIKQRKKEFGLYSVLGMEKKHILAVIFTETAMTSFISTFSGIAFGMMFYKLVSLVLFKMLKFDVKLGFYVSLQGIIVTAAIFSFIFLLTFIVNCVKLKKTNPIELIKGSEKGKTEPKTKLPAAILGAAFLIAGYAIALSVKDPLSAISLFFIAVLCVIAGTYLLFMTGSIAFLKMLRNNKNYYYNKRHFNNISGMIYRMKQNAVGLANICILSTMVLVTVCSTVSLYVGAEDTVKRSCPNDADIHINVFSEAYYEDNNFDPVGPEGTKQLVDLAAEKTGVSLVNMAKVDYFEVTARFENNEYHLGEQLRNVEAHNVYVILFMPAKSYEELTGNKPELGKDQLGIYSSTGAVPSGIRILDTEYNVCELETMRLISDYSTVINNVHYVVMPDDAAFERLYTQYEETVSGSASNIAIPSVETDLYFDISTDNETLKIKYADELRNLTDKYLSEDENRSLSYYFSFQWEERAHYYEMYGSFLFLGLVLGMLFLMVTVMIIYYKQISEGYSDRSKYIIMQKVGMSSKEVKETIHSQILTVFFLPLVTAFIHLAFAFPLIAKLLKLFMLKNIAVFLLCTIAACFVFAVVYTAVYLLTAKTYYKIVS